MCRIKCRVLIVCFIALGITVSLWGIYVWRTTRFRSRVVFSHTAFELFPELYSKVVAVRTDPDQEAPKPDVIYLNLSNDINIICGKDPFTADCYVKRWFFLRGISRIRRLAKEDVEDLLAYLRSQDENIGFYYVAELKNDVMNLLRNQESPVEGLADTLMEMYNSGEHLPVILDPCIQHLGAMVNELDDTTRTRAREVLVKAARDTSKAYAGAALYSLAEDRRATPAQNAELKQLTLALCAPDASDAARIASIQLSGQLGYVEALPALRATLSSGWRNVVLDAVAIGSVGLLGDEDDVAFLERFAGDVGRAAAVEAAIKRIKERVRLRGIDPCDAGEEVMRPNLMKSKP